ncbi:MAG: hypothetical protein ABR910_15085 [Acidobacteriaceae bacterium]|jgi:hypothetical protein
MNVYISHSARSQIGRLQDLLKRDGVSFRDSFDPSVGGGVTATARAEIQRADAVIAVLADRAPNVLFEIGLAVGLRKPVLVLLPPGVAPPTFVAPMNYLTSDGSDTEILRLGLTRFLSKVKGRRSRESPRPDTSPLVRDNSLPVQSLTERIAYLRRAGNPLEVEEFVARVLQSAGVTAVEDSNDKGVDFAVWSDSLRDSLGGPVLIEVKAAAIDPISFQSAYDRLNKQVIESGSPAGVLLYLERKGRRFGSPGAWNPSVLWFDIEDFSIEILRKNLGEVLAERRNRIVHGLDS